MSSVATDLNECLNCQAPMHGPFCARCGQKRTHPDPTFHDLLHDLTHELLHIDGRLWTSLRLLFTRPGFLTREHVAGRRASYLPPLRLYLICSVAYFGLTAVAPSDTSIQVEDRRGRVLVVGGVRISGEALLSTLSDEQIVERVHRAQHDWLPKFLFMLVPVWAVLVKFVTWREHRNFPEHLYFALHIHAANFGARAVAAALRFAHSQVLDSAWTGLTLLFVVWYVTVALRQVYGRSTAIAFRRAVSLLAMYFVVVVITFGLFVIIAIRM